VMAKKEPARRDKYADLQARHGAYIQEQRIPTYVRRLLTRCGNKNPEQVAAEIVEQAMLLQARSLMRPPRYAGHGGHDYMQNLLCGRYVAGNEATLCAQLERETKDIAARFEILNKPMVACVSNKVYGYFFVVDRVTGFRADLLGQDEPGPFLTWVQTEWGRTNPIARKEVAGAVITLGKGDWPLHPRLIPGHAWASDLEYATG
jgi:hypothetical protein